MFSRFSINSEAKASELIENLEEMLFILIFQQIIQPNDDELRKKG